VPADWPLKCEMHPVRQAGGDDRFGDSLIRGNDIFRQDTLMH